MEDGYRITTAIYEKADEMDWCSEYDEWAEDTNAVLKFFTIPLMRNEYNVTYTITRTQEAQVTVKVTARNEEDAEEAASEDNSSYDLADTVRNSDWDTQDVTIDNVEVDLA